MKKLASYLIVLILIVPVAFSCNKPEKVDPEEEEPLYVYVTSLGGSTYALDANTGETVWQFNGSSDLDEPSSPTIVENVVYVTGREKVYALDAFSGAVIWESSPISFGSASPTVKDGTVYVGAMDGKLYALDIRSGEQKWAFDSFSYIVCAPTVVNDEVYFSDITAKLRCLDKNTGQLKWETKDFSGTYRSNPVYYDNSILVGLNYAFVSLNAKTGDLNWRFQSDGEVISSPVIYNHKVFFGSTYGYSVFAVDIATKKRAWSMKSPDGDQVYSSPYVKNDTLWIGFLNGRFYSLNADNGSINWEVDVKDKIYYSSPVAAGNKIYLPTYSSLLCLNASDGSESWGIRGGIGSRVSSPTVLLKNGKVRHPAPSGQEDGE